MRHGRIAACAVAALFVLAGAPAAAEEAHVYIAPHAWFGDLSGDVPEALEADGVDVHLGFDFLARLGRHRIVAGYTQGEYDGDVLDGTIELKRQRAFYGFSFVNTSLVDFGVLVGGDGYKVTVESNAGDFDIDSPAPAIGLNLGIRPPVVPLRLYAEAVVSSLEVSNVDTTLTDAYVALDWYLIPVVKLFGVQVGYRYYDLDAEDKDKALKFEGKFQGPFAGLVFRL